MTAPLAWYFDFISPFSYLQWQRLKPMLRDARTPARNR